MNGIFKKREGVQLDYGGREVGERKRGREWWKRGREWERGRCVKYGEKGKGDRVKRR